MEQLQFPELVDIETVAKLLGVGERYVRRMVAERQIEFVKIGHYVRFDLEVVRKWVEERAETSTRSAHAGVSEPTNKPLAPMYIPRRHISASVRYMPSVQIKSVPEDVHAELRRRAANEGKSLQEYLLGRLIEEARRPSLDELLARAGQRSGGRVSFRFASEAIREDRDAG